MIVSVIWRKPVLTYAVTVSIDGVGEFGEFGEMLTDRNKGQRTDGCKTYHLCDGFFDGGGIKIS